MEEAGEKGGRRALNGSRQMNMHWVTEVLPFPGMADTAQPSGVVGGWVFSM